jgi:hypothetical protein
MIFSIESAAEPANPADFLTGSLYHFENSAQGVEKALPLPGKARQGEVSGSGISLPEVTEIFNKDISAGRKAAREGCGAVQRISGFLRAWPGRAASCPLKNKFLKRVKIDKIE